MGEVRCLFCGLPVDEWLQEVALDDFNRCPRCGVLLGFTSDPTTVSDHLKAKHGRIGRVLTDFPLEVELEEGVRQVWLVCAWRPEEELSTAEVAKLLGITHTSSTRLCRELHEQTGLGRRGESWLLPRSLIWEVIHLPRSLR